MKIIEGCEIKRSYVTADTTISFHSPKNYSSSVTFSVDETDYKMAIIMLEIHFLAINTGKIVFVNTTLCYRVQHKIGTPMPIQTATFEI